MSASSRTTRVWTSFTAGQRYRRFGGGRILSRRDASPPPRPAPGAVRSPPAARDRALSRAADHEADVARAPRPPSVPRGTGLRVRRPLLRQGRPDEARVVSALRPGADRTAIA